MILEIVVLYLCVWYLAQKLFWILIVRPVCRLIYRAGIRVAHQLKKGGRYATTNLSHHVRALRYRVSRPVT
jgi:hypothetical protein